MPRPQLSNPKTKHQAIQLRKESTSAESKLWSRIRRDQQEEYDGERTKYLEAQRYKVIRFWNNQVLNDIDGVIRAIILAMEPKSHSRKEI